MHDSVNFMRNLIGSRFTHLNYVMHSFINFVRNLVNFMHSLSDSSHHANGFSATLLIS